MRSRVLILASLVALAAIVLVVGVAVAGAGQSDPLPGHLGSGPAREDGAGQAT